MKLEIELSEEQLKMIINALEVNFWLMMNQGNIVADLLSVFPDESKFKDKESWDRALDSHILRRDICGKLLCVVANTLYYDAKIQKSATRLSDMWSVLRHTQYKLRESGDESDVRSYSPIQISDLDLIKVKILEK